MLFIYFSSLVSTISATFTETHSGPPGVSISLRWYAHRLLTSCLVLELDMSRDDVTTEVKVRLKVNQTRPASPDIELVSRAGRWVDRKVGRKAGG